jgi:hypothetical protein
MCDAIPPTRRQQSEHEQPSYLHHDGRPCRNADRLKEMLKGRGKLHVKKTYASYATGEGESVRRDHSPDGELHFILEVAPFARHWPETT